MAGRSGTGEGLAITGWGGKLVKVRRGDIGVVCSLTAGAAGVGEEGAGEWRRVLKEEDATSRDILGISTVGDNKDNLAKCVDGEETDAGDAEAGVFLAFFDLRRGGTGGGGMIAESGMQ